MTLQFQTAHIPLASGINTRADERALEPPGLAICRNGEFTELGGIQKRKPFEAMSTDIVGGGTLSDVRKIATYEDELLCFTKTKIYSWSDRDSGWVEKADYLAPKVTERPQFIDTTEQTCADRAELSGVIYYAWEENTVEVFVGAVDAETGAVLLSPTKFDVSGILERPRLVALDSVVLLFVNDNFGNVIKVAALDPDDVTTVPSSATSLSTATNGEYDVEAFSSTKAVIAFSTSGGYEVAFVTEAAAEEDESSKARTSDGAIAVSVRDNASGGLRFVLVGRSDSGQVQADVLSDGLVDEQVDIDVGSVHSTPINHITAAWESDDGATVNWRVFFVGDQKSGDDTFQAATALVDSTGSSSEDGTLPRSLGIASRAFVRDGTSYIWLTFAGATGSTFAAGDFKVQDQNAYFLYDHNGTLIAKAVQHAGAGFSQRDGHLPNVQDLGSDAFAWCAGERRVIPIGTKSLGYAQRGLRDVAFEFDSDEARRTAQLGRTLYIAGGQILQYDGEGITELGFHIYPWFLNGSSTSGGNQAEGTRAFRGTWRWDNAKGEIDRSTTALTETVEHTADDRLTRFKPKNLPVTLKQDPRSNLAIEIWGTLVNPAADSPLYLRTDKDPTNDGLSENEYLENDPESAAPTFDDDLTDDEASVKETLPESGGVLENLVAPAASIVVAGDERLFLAGIAHDPYAVWYSKLRGEGEVASFHDALIVRLPSTFGEVTALEVLNETLVVFQERAVHILPGEGFDNTGGGQNYGPARRVSADVGAISQDALGITPEGIVFHSPKGWYLLNRGFTLQYIGGPVHGFDSDTFVSVNVMESEQQIRCLSSSGRMLVFDWVAQQWSEWTIDDGLDSVIWQGSHVYLSTEGPKKQRDDFTGVDYSLDIETAWFKLAGLQGFKRMRRLMILGEYRSAHDLRIRIARDYDDSTYFDDKSWTVDPVAVGGPEQVRHQPSIQKVDAMKVRITDTAVGGGTPTGESLKLTGLSVEYGVHRGLMRLQASQKQ